METKLHRDVRLLKAYSFLTTLLLAAIAFSTRRGYSEPQVFEIDVERINIVQKDGKLKLFISNSERQHPGVVDGVDAKNRGHAIFKGIRSNFAAGQHPFRSSEAL